MGPSHRGIRVSAAARFALAAALCLAPAGPIPAQTAREYSIKASFISRFVGFIQWPSGQAARGALPEPFVVSVFGPDPFLGDLESAFREADLGGRKVTVRRAADLGDLSESKLVFIAQGEKGRLDSVVRWAEANGALTIGDGEGFAERGVIINFYLRDQKVRFEINARAAEKCGFQISSLLLKVARIVEDG